MTHYITSSTTRKKSWIANTMNRQNTSLEYKKEFKQIYSTSFVKKHAKNYSNYRETSLLHMHINDENQSNHFATQTLVTYVKTQEVL